MNDFGRQTTDQRRTDTRPSTHRAAPIPSLRTDTRAGWQRWTISFGATAAALIIIVVAVTLFNMRPHPSGASSTSVSATQTAQAQSHPGAAIGGVRDGRLDGLTDGRLGDWHTCWAGTYPTPAGGATPSSVVIFYHYNGSEWVQEWRHSGDSEPTGVGGDPYLKMLSPTDGWAYDGAGSHYCITMGQPGVRPPSAFPAERTSTFRRLTWFRQPQGWVGGGCQRRPREQWSDTLRTLRWRAMDARDNREFAH